MRSASATSHAEFAPRAAIPLGTTLGLVAAAAGEALAADAVATLLWSERERRLALAASIGLGDLAAHALASLPASALWRLADAPGQTLASMGAASDLRERLVPFAPIAVVTIPPEGRPIGVLVALRHQDASLFTAADLRLLAVFAGLELELLDTAQLDAGEVPESDPREVEELKSSLLSIVSHELQTPVSVIKAYASTLTREDVVWNPERVRQLGATIEEECDRLHRLIVDLLDMARIQAGRVAVISAPVALPALVRQVVEQIARRAPDHRFQVEFPPDFPEVEGDQEKLRRLLVNLLDNAVKYSPRGGEITVTGAVVPAGEGEAPHAVEIRVRDEGIGLPAAERGRIFSRFHRVDTRLARTTPGAGLGLYIARAIVDTHRGRIWAESEGLGKGSTFVFTLPLSRVAASQRAPGSPLVGEPPGRRVGRRRRLPPGEGGGEN